MKNDEIEIKELLVLGYKFFVRHKIFWVITIVVALLISGLKYKKVKPYYNAEMIITSNLIFEKSKDINIVDLQPVVSVLSILQTQVERHNYKFIKDLGLENPSIIKDLKITVIRDKNLRSIEPKNIKISVEVYDKSKLKEIQSLIMKFCNENKYINDKFVMQKTIMQKTVEIVDERVKFLDTLEYAVMRSITTENANLFLNFSDLNSVVSLEVDRYKYNYLISIDNVVSIVQPFSKYPNTINKKLSISVVYFFVIIFIGIVLALTYEFFKYIRDVKK